MYLKRLEIHGFKSFAQRTLFEFGPGISAIVGPNGTGKSNIADALRWVLGEQSSRVLRTRKLEEIIFAGSPKRPSLGMAEVALVLDNGGGWLPIDFAEVAIGRRLYRSGESEYLINHTRVRLRDVADLLLRANLGQGSYAVLGQGAVDSILTMRPDERGGLIEEAARVVHYRARLQEATARLQATRENMARLRLLLGEIEPRLTQLERQAKRAADYGRLSQELAAALQNWYGQLWHRTQDALAASRAAYDQRREGYSSAQREAHHQEERASALAAEVERQREGVARRQREELKLAAEARHAELSVAFDEDRLQLLQARRSELAQEVAALEEEQAAEGSRRAEAPADPQALEREASLARSELEARRRELDETEREFVALRNAIVGLEEKAARAQAARREVERQLKRYREESQRLDKELAAMAERRVTLGRQLKAVASRLREVKDRDAALAAQMSQHVAQQRALGRVAAEARSGLAEAERSLQEVSQALTGRRSRYDVLTELQSDRAGLTAALRTLFGDLPERGGAPAGPLIEVVGRLVRVPVGLEKAIEAALGENLQTLVMPHEEEAYAAIETVIERQAGRVTIVPLDSLHDTRPLNLISEKGVIGVASQLVKCDGRFRRLVDTLLGRVIVVDTVATARKMITRGLGSIVTLDGVHLRPSGAISGGTSPGPDSLFAWEEELEELPLEIAEMETRRRDAEREVAARRSALEADEAAAATIAQKAEALRRESGRAQEELAAIRHQAVQLRGEIAWLVIAEKKAQGQRAALETERAELAREREQLQAEATEAAASAAQQRQGEALLAGRREALMTAVGEATAKLAALEGERRSVELLQQSWQRTAQRLARQLAQQQEQMQQLEREAAAAAARLEEHRRGLEAARRRHAAAEKAAPPAEEALGALLQEQRGCQVSLQEARAQLMAAERSCLEAETEVQRRADELASLRRLLEAEGLTVDRRGEVVTAEAGGAPESGFRVPPLSGAAEVAPQALEGRIQRLRQQLRALGPVNVEARADYTESRERYDFLHGQLRDLEQAEASLRQAIDELQETIRSGFQQTFERVNQKFGQLFAEFFGGGHAELRLVGDDGETGVELLAQPPGRRLSGLPALSGGERALTAIALLFSLLAVNPAPFCILDEVDAALDDANVGRFTAALRRLAEGTQFLVVTHNRGTIEAADTIYGLSMGEDHSSRVLSLRLADIPPN